MRKIFFFTTIRTWKPSRKDLNNRVERRSDFMADALYLHSLTADLPPAPDEAQPGMYLPLEFRQSTRASCREVQVRPEFGEIIGDSEVLKSALDLLSIV